MPGFWFRLRRLVGAEAHGAAARLEDPVRLAEAGVRDLRANLTEAVTSLARIKGVALRLRREQGEAQERAGDFRRKAVALVQRGRSGELEGAEADRLAAEALRLQGDAEARGVLLEKRAGEQERLAARLQTRIEELRRLIGTYEDDLLTLQARATTAVSVKRINRHLAGADVSDTVALLERMRGRVAEEEALAEAYGQLGEAPRSAEREIDDALAGRGAADLHAQASLTELKRQIDAGDAG